MTEHKKCRCMQDECNCHRKYIEGVERYVEQLEEKKDSLKQALQQERQEHKATKARMHALQQHLRELNDASQQTVGRAGFLSQSEPTGEQLREALYNLIAAKERALSERDEAHKRLQSLRESLLTLAQS